jgi:hypothetical protein
MSARWVAVLALVFLAAACAHDPYAPLPEPDVAKGPTTTTTTLPDLDNVALAGVRGTTTTVPKLGPGPITIIGRVDGPDGPVAGAIVHLDRITDAGTSGIDVPTAVDGTWNLANVLGGRYRVRAWLAPTLGMSKAVTVFLEQPNPKPVVLKLAQFGGAVIDWAIAPNPPPVAERVNLKVRVSNRTVDSQGYIDKAPVYATSVTLSGGGRWTLYSENPQYTDADGSAVFELACREAGPQPLTVQLENGDTRTLDLPACVDASVSAPE